MVVTTPLDTRACFEPKRSWRFNILCFFLSCMRREIFFCAPTVVRARTLMRRDLGPLRSAADEASRRASMHVESCVALLLGGVSVETCKTECCGNFPLHDVVR